MLRRGGRSPTACGAPRSREVRSRPDVKLFLSPSTVTPGSRLLVRAVLEAKSETPIDFVSMTLACHITSATGEGEDRSEYKDALFLRAWRSPSQTLLPGTHPFHVAFDLPDDLPASYAGTGARIEYTVRVHVPIPWWPDRDETFSLLVVWPDSPASPPPEPKSFATSIAGPRGLDPFMEVAIETAELAIGEALAGSVSLQNLRGKRVRGVEVSFVEVESVTQPATGAHPGQRFAVRIHDGTPREGAPMPFRVAVPDGATAAFRAGPISVATHLEVRAIVAWGEDLVVRAPLRILPRAAAPRANAGWVAPVGRERRAIAWQSAAERIGFVSDHEAERMTRVSGGVTIAITTRESDGDFWLVATLGYASLGLDLDLTRRKWTDRIALSVVKIGVPELDEQLAAHAREHAQAKAALTPALLTAVAAFEEIQIGDRSATLARRGTAHSFNTLTAFMHGTVDVAKELEAAAALVPAPAAFAADVPAWRAFAERHRGRLELGRMHVYDAVIGIDCVTVATDWTRSGQLVGTRLQVAIDPPLTAVPATPDDPSISPAARNAWRALLEAGCGLRLELGALRVELDGKLADPATALPILELAVALRRALSGIAGAGPFR